jgi:hypothetical protein
VLAFARVRPPRRTRTRNEGECALLRQYAIPTRLARVGYYLVATSRTRSFSLSRAFAAEARERRKNAVWA